jgi:predicted AAA+ superfamily ATPase
MKRIVFNELINWKNSKRIKTLMLRGVRQVGKSYLDRELGKEFDNFIEINLEENPKSILRSFKFR